MPEAVLAAKDPAKVAAGQAGAAKRWSDPANRTVVRLDSLSTAERAVVLALIDAKKAAPADANAGTAEQTEGHGNGAPIAS
jgi:hypothetical protein